MIQHDGMWWPDADKRARQIITGDCERDVGFILPYIEGRECIVQAGGNVGVYALALAFTSSASSRLSPTLRTTPVWTRTLRRGTGWGGW